VVDGWKEKTLQYIFDCVSSVIGANFFLYSAVSPFEAPFGAKSSRPDFNQTRLQGFIYFVYSNDTNYVSYVESAIN